ncbi:protein kinase [Lipomyces tetrasporus]
MTQSSWVFEPPSLDNIEQIEGYRKGGFHPVSIGDSFSRGRYRILHKLGFGGFSTVWLARDEHSHRLVSLKIITAEASSTCNELKILQHLKEGATYHPGCDHILSVFDDFTIEGPNGVHTCLVSLFAGPDIAQISDSPGRRAGSRRLRGALARKFAKQATIAVGYLHSRGVAHGDLNTSNILIQLSHVDLWSDQDVYELLGFPVTDKVRLWSGELNNMVSAPKYLVEPADLSNLESKWFTEKALLVDFGQSFMLHSPPPRNEVGYTMSYCAPELYFEGKASVWSDIWALGCTIFEIRAGCQLFESFLGGPHEVIQQIVQTLGKLPEPWWSSWEKHDVYFDEDGKPKKYGPNNTRMLTEHPLIQQIKEIGEADYDSITDEVAVETNILKNNVRAEPETDSILEPPGVTLTQTEVEVFEDLLRKVLRYNPETRLPVAEILKHAWFTASFEDCRSVNGSSIFYNRRG